jgi:hypothetical protein
VLEDTLRTSGHRRRYQKSLHATHHTGAEKQLQMIDLVIDVTLTIASTTLDDPGI